MNLKQKLTSRKFWLSIAVIIISVLLPIIYKGQNISDYITMMVIGIVGAIGSAYLGFNVLAQIKGKDE